MAGKWWVFEKQLTDTVSRPPKTTIFDVEGVDRLLVMGGTILGTTNKGIPFTFPMPDGTRSIASQDIIDGYHRLGTGCPDRHRWRW
ncbi:MAG UNVERIFIED_CONTAM: hypothetical protein LVR29_28035 [Microcystis novacekii LVE1205-3]